MKYNVGDIVRLVTLAEANETLVFNGSEYDRPKDGAASSHFLTMGMIRKFGRGTLRVVTVERTEYDEHIYTLASDDDLPLNNSLKDMGFHPWMLRPATAVATKAEAAPTVPNDLPNDIPNDIPLRLQYTGAIALLMRIRKQVDEDEKDCIDAAIRDAQNLGVLKDAKQQESGEWFV